MKADKVQKIREEVERLYNQSLADENRQADRGLENAANVSYGKSKACKELLSFIDSMKEEPISDDLEKAAWNYGDELDNVLVVGIDDDNTVGEYATQAFKAGANWQKQQMMAKAIEGDITFDYDGYDDKTYGCIAHDSFCLEDLGLKDKDKVKMIIIKED